MEFIISLALSTLLNSKVEMEREREKTQAETRKSFLISIALEINISAISSCILKNNDLSTFNEMENRVIAVEIYLFGSEVLHF